MIALSLCMNWAVFLLCYKKCFVLLCFDAATWKLSFIHVELSESLDFIFTLSKLTASVTSALGGDNSVGFRKLRSCIARRLVTPNMHTTSVTGELMRTVDSRNSGV